jgi:hypothetical protein
MEQAIGQALIIVDDVEAMMGQKLANLEISSDAKGSHFGEHAYRGCRKFVEIERVENAQRIALGEEVFPAFNQPVVEVQALQLVHPDAIGNIRVGRPHHYIYLVTHALQLTGEVIEVNPLTTAVFIPPIAKKTYSQPDSPP